MKNIFGMELLHLLHYHHEFFLEVWTEHKVLQENLLGFNLIHVHIRKNIYKYFLKLLVNILHSNGNSGGALDSGFSFEQILSLSSCRA